MRYLIFPCAFSLCFFSAALCQAQGAWSWGRGATGPGQSEGAFCAVDAWGGVYASGVGSNACHFGTDSVTGKGVYVAKYDTSGNYRWVIGSTSSYAPVALGITTDPFGNEYIFGSYRSYMTFGGIMLTPPTFTDAYFFLAKIDSAGGVRWIRTMGTVMAGYQQDGTDIVADDLGNLYVTCAFAHNGVLGSYTVTNDTTDSSPDILVAKLDSSGAVTWVKTFGGTKNDMPAGIAVSAWHDVYITGSFNSPALSFGSLTISDTGAHPQNIYIVKLDKNGNPLWASSAAGSGTPTGIAVSPTQEVFVSGSYHLSTMQLDTIILPFAPSVGTGYGFVAKYDPGGHVAWAKSLQGAQAIPYTPVVDRCGNVWVTVNFGSNVCTDVIDGHTLTSPSGSHDPMLLVGWSDTGAFLQSSILMSGGDDRSGIAIDGNKNIFVVGDYESTSFVVGPDVMTNGMEYNFVAKYKPNITCPDAIPLSQRSMAAEEDVKLYPNPAYSSFTVKLAAAAPTGGNITVYDLAGRQVQTQPLTGAETTICAATLAPGMYVCRISNGTGMVCKKLIVVR
jgi:hypothetical protein